MENKELILEFSKNDSDGCFVKYFKATKKTKRFNLNQKVWVSLECANHLYVRFKYRGKGRYVNGVVDKFSKCVGDIKTIEVSKLFCNRVNLKS